MTGSEAWVGNSAAALLFSCRLGISTGGENQTWPCPRTVTNTAAAVILGGKVLGVNHCVPADQQVGSTTLICHVPCGQFMASRHHWLERFLADFLPNVRP